MRIDYALARRVQIRKTFLRAGYKCERDEEQQSKQRIPLRCKLRRAEEVVKSILKQHEESVSGGIGQPQPLSPTASLNLFKLSCFAAG